MMIVNAVLHQQGVQNEYRLSFGIIQIGIIEMTMALGVLYALVRGGSIRSQYPALRTHPVLVWVLAPLFLGGLVGIFGGLINGSEPKFFLSSAREFIAIPLCVYAGYRLVGTPAHVRVASIMALICGVLTATMLFWSFGEKSEAASLSGSIGHVRGIITHWHSEYAPVAAFILIYVILTRFPLWKTWICIIVGVYCYIGYAATISRLGFLILFFGTASTYMLLPAGDRARKFLRSLVFIPVLFFACWGALWAGDQIIGRDFAGKVLKHMESLLPKEREGSTDYRAWDSRVGGIVAELGLWAKNPLIGQGFGTGETEWISGRGGGADLALKHNGWTGSLAETGLIGFTGLFMMVFSMILIGYRMVHDRTDTISMLAGAMGFFAGVVYLMRVTGTMSITSRAALGFGLVAGVLIRAREIQETQVAIALEQAQLDAYVDDETGLLVPDYAYEMGHFGTN